MTYEEFARRWDAMSSRERDVWVAEAVLGCRAVYVRALEGHCVVDVGREELEPVLAGRAVFGGGGVMGGVAHFAVRKGPGR